tara:strand:+ start:167 stop:616 length:450 start_codon:yes stop_codon:yes gene_type:complete
MTITTIKPPYEMPYTTTINQVVFKGCEIKPIGKTGYFSEKIPASGPSQGSKGSTAPAVYRLRGPDNKVIDQFLSLASLRAAMVRRGISTKPTKKETAAEAYARGLQEGIKQGLAMANEERYEAGYDEGLKDEREYQTAKWEQKIRLGNI